jgi:molybdenum cofactor cytidylyltransferase
MATEGSAKLANLDAVVLAAGLGSRFGGGKLLAPWRGGVLLDGALAAAFAAPVRSVIMVWGADEGVRAAAEGFARGVDGLERLRLAHASDFADGLSASLKAGIRAVPGDSDGAFVFLGDMPRIPLGVAATLADALRTGASAAAPTFEGERGHPVLFGKALLPQLLELSGDQGAGRLLKGLGEALVLVPASDSGVLYDVDRPEDLTGGENADAGRR